MNLPNILTLFRMFLVPTFILVFFSDINNHIFYSIVIFLMAGFTDVLDGYIARKHDLVTKWGIVAIYPSNTSVKPAIKNITIE